MGGVVFDPAGFAVNAVNAMLRAMRWPQAS